MHICNREVFFVEKCGEIKQDIVTKDYINSPGVFADAFNYFVYNGEQKIKSEKLQALDTSEVAVLLGKEVPAIKMLKIK